MDQGKKLEETVFSYMRQYSMIEAGDRVIAGVSGGADSVCLLFLLWEYAKEVDFSLQVVHVNHQIRGEEALRDQEFTKSLCKSLGIPVSVYSYPVTKIAKERHMSVEEAGRMARREAFLLEQEKCGAARTALAHHRDDLAETVLHNLARGTGVAGMAGIRPVRRMDGLVCIRPLLCIGRGEIEKWLTGRGISWVEDSTNKEPDYTRNKIRQTVLPALGEVNSLAAEHIGEAAGIFCQVEEYLDIQTDMLYKRHVACSSDGICLHKGIFGEHPLMQTCVIKRAIEEAAGQKRDITALHVKSVQKLYGQQTGSAASLPWGLTARVSYGDIWITRGEWENQPEKELEFEIFPYENQQIPEKKYTKWFDYDKIKNDLTVRKRQPGDYLCVGDRGGRKKLKDYFIDCKIPRQEREDITLLADGSHILWVVGYRISEYYKITEETKRVIKVQVKGESEDE